MYNARALLLYSLTLKIRQQGLISDCGNQPLAFFLRSVCRTAIIGIAFTSKGQRLSQAPPYTWVPEIPSEDACQSNVLHGCISSLQGVSPIHLVEIFKSYTTRYTPSVAHRLILKFGAAHRDVST